MGEAGASRGPYRTGVRRRQQILEAAMATFARRGYAGASLRQIADAVGLTPAGLLRYFGSKERLFSAVLDQWERDTDRLLPSVETGLERFLRMPDLMRYHEAHPGLIELFLTLAGEASDPDHPAHSWIAKRYDRIVAEGVEQLRIAGERGDVRVMDDDEREREVRALFALMDGLELQWITNTALDLTGTFTAVLDTMVAGWRRPSAGKSL